MTAPQGEGADRISGGDKSPLSASAVGFGSGIAILLFVGLLLRLVLAYVLLPGSGFESDTATFTAWAAQLAKTGPGSFYATAGFADYPPGYMYVLWLVGELGTILAPFAHNDVNSAIAALIKIPPILMRHRRRLVLYLMVKAWGRSRGRTLAERRARGRRSISSTRSRGTTRRSGARRTRPARWSCCCRRLRR